MKSKIMQDEQSILVGKIWLFYCCLILICTFYTYTEKYVNML